MVTTLRLGGARQPLSERNVAVGAAGSARGAARSAGRQRARPAAPTRLRTPSRAPPSTRHPPCQCRFHHFAVRIKARCPPADPSRPKILAACDRVLYLTAPAAEAQRAAAARLATLLAFVIALLGAFSAYAMAPSI
jgi:hypothetical protein